MHVVTAVLFASETYPPTILTSVHGGVRGCVSRERKCVAIQARLTI